MNPRYLWDPNDKTVQEFHSSGASHMSANVDRGEYCGTLNIDWNSLVMKATTKGNFRAMKAESQQGHS
jgi:hypothetical protein